MNKDMIGATVLPGKGTQFRVWAPFAKTVDLAIEDTTLPMEEDGDYFTLLHPEELIDKEYFFLLDKTKKLPDPASRFQPKGVHGPSQVVDHHTFTWHDDNWKGHSLKDYIIYELHVGTFTKEGTFSGVISKLPHLKELGVTAIEIMPVAAFPGTRNWGYDGVFCFATHACYGGPEELKKLVDACHKEGLSVILDVVYNHFGPEGCVLHEYGPYLTDTYHTPWGQAINFDERDSDHVRAYFLQNALYWVDTFHVDALRLDAVHAIFDFSAYHILEELGDFLKEHTKRPIHLIAESDLNNSRLIRPKSMGGYQIDAQFNDDFHHAMQAFFTKIEKGYFKDFGTLSDICKALKEGYIYSGQYSSYRKRRHGNISKDLPKNRFVIFLQNHDQVANAFQGKRLSKTLSCLQQKCAAAILFFAQNIPLLFMGQEWGETNPFYFFTSFEDDTLIKNVREGRFQEHEHYCTGEKFYDPQDPATFEKSKISWDHTPEQQKMLAFYKELITLRKTERNLAFCPNDSLDTHFSEETKSLQVIRKEENGTVKACLISNLSDTPQIPLEFSPEGWHLILSTTEEIQDAWGVHIFVAR